ncbi:MAG: CRISPR-associated protein Cas4 [Candidatus Woesearchaeota archaeon]
MISVTQLSSYVYCPRKLFISSILKIKEPPKESLIKGKVWHQTFDLINKGEKNVVFEIKSVVYEDILDLYKKNFSKYLRKSIINNKKSLASFNISPLSLFKEFWPNILEEAKLRAFNVYSFILRERIVPPINNQLLWDRLSPKIYSEQYVVSEKLGVSGIIDFIEVYSLNNNEFYVPIELKTGKHPSNGIWDTHKVQIGAYILILESIGKNSFEGFLKYSGLNDKKSILMDKNLREYLLKIIEETKKVLSLKEPPHKINNKNKCEACSFKELCYDEETLKIRLKEVFRNST